MNALPIQTLVESIHAPEDWDGSEGLLAVLISGAYDAHGITFFTTPELSQQVAFMRHERGHAVEPHTHHAIRREVYGTQEVLLVRRGRLRVDFYTLRQEYLASRVLGPGDVAVLVRGGHGLECLDECELIEVKQGPYLGRNRDKIVFQPEG